MLVQKRFQLVGIEIGQHFIARDERRHVSLVGELAHLFISVAVPADIDLRELKAALGQIFLRIDAPGTPRPAIKSNVSHGIGINPTRFSASTVAANQYAFAQYTRRALGFWARRVRAWQAARKDVYVYFDNDVKVRAPFDALVLMEKLGVQWRAAEAAPFKVHRAGARIPRLKFAYGPRVTGGNPAWERLVRR